MNDNSINFGSTKILYNQSKSLVAYLEKIKNYKSMNFELLGLGNMKQAKNIKPNQIAVIPGKDALVIRGANKDSDELVYNILTDNGKLQDKCLSYVDDFKNATESTFNTIA